MAENFPNSQQENREIKRKSDYEKLDRLKINLMKLEKSVISEVDEATHTARGAIKAMGFGVSPIVQLEDEDEE